ncbi:MAG: lamin tail domain-containing protein, partial [bacterium]|nr:lamin tail domain-containing protein [bacterium]
MQNKIVRYLGRKKRVALVISLFSLSQVFASWAFASLANAETAPIISAVQITGGTGKTSEDFIELYNPSSVHFNLKGYRLVKRSATGTTDSLIKSWTADAYIPPHSFYLWANSDFTSISTAPDLTSTATLAGHNGVALRFGASDTGTTIDSIAWGVTTNSFTNVSATNPAVSESVTRLNVFDLAAGFSILPSSPRNSNVQLLPPTPDDPAVLVDNATCNPISPQSVIVGGAVSLTVSVQNTGTTQWEPNSYGLNQSVLNIVTALSQAVAPAASAEFPLNLSAPTTEGEYSYV